MASGVCCGGLTATPPLFHHVQKKARRPGFDTARASGSTQRQQRVTTSIVSTKHSNHFQKVSSRPGRLFFPSTPQNTSILSGLAREQDSRPHLHTIASNVLTRKQGTILYLQPFAAPSRLATKAINLSTGVALSPDSDAERSQQSGSLSELAKNLGSESDSSAADASSSYPHEPFADYIADAVERLRPQFEQVDRTVALNLRRVLDAYREARVGSHHLTGSTGYGHNDAGGREALDKAFARIVGAEAAIVRSQFFSGTHAIAAALFAVLRPGDELLAVAGAPYDTLEEVIGLRGMPGHGSLAEFGVTYRALPLTPGGKLDFAALETAVGETTKCALIQRSCGYSWRETLTMDDIERAVKVIKRQNLRCAIVVDNCYGEFVDTREPTAVGADLIAGSLIKNPGGSIAPGGGYVAGREDLVDAAAARLSAPGIGREAGATPSSVQRLMLQGLFLSPQIVGEAVKSSLLLAEVLAAEGFATKPPPRAPRHDIIQAVQLGSRERLLAFCQAVQTMCPVGAYIRPTAGATAGYESEVVFADGTFIDGSTIELSCDGPLREPFVVYCQGGTHWTHWAIALEAAVAAMRALD